VPPAGACPELLCLQPCSNCRAAPLTLIADEQAWRAQERAGDGHTLFLACSSSRQVVKLTWQRLR
jgi:hypothetical protein